MVRVDSSLPQYERTTVLCVCKADCFWARKIYSARMARKEAVPPREVEICQRLHTFRLSTKIPRSAFALSVGISASRLSEYENGRVPLRYDTFRAVNAKFFINLRWLVTGAGESTDDRPFDDAQFRSLIRDRELLSAVYDSVIAQHQANLDQQSGLRVILDSAVLINEFLNKPSLLKSLMEDGVGAVLENHRQVEKLSLLIEESAQRLADLARKTSHSRGREGRAEPKLPETSSPS